MRHLFCLLLVLTGGAVTAQKIPQDLVGKWVIWRELPTRTISCWGEKEARAIIGTHIKYTPDSFTWMSVAVRHPKVEVRAITAEQFERENSSPSANGSQVSFRQLGIDRAEAKRVTIEHPPAEVTKATTEIPGDVVLLKDQGTIIFSVCSVYFEARRLRP